MGANGATGMQSVTGAKGASGAKGPTGPSFSSSYRAGDNVAVSKSGNTYTYTYPTALAAGTYAVLVQLRGAQNLGFTGNATMPYLTILTSTNTGFTFELRT
jgi:hypothetical protein